MIAQKRIDKKVGFPVGFDGRPSSGRDSAARHAARHWLACAILEAGLALALPAAALPPSLPGLPGIIAQGAPLSAPAPLEPHPCMRPAAGSLIGQPKQVYSANGVLNVHLDFYTDVDANGYSIFCFLMPDGSPSPTLHARPGDLFNLEVTNHVAPVDSDDPDADAVEEAGHGPTQCGEQFQFEMDPSSVNVHFHGFLVTPRCQGDDVYNTVISAGDTFQYSFPIPANEPPGLFWFHPHVHGSGEQTVQGGASGTLIIDGIEQFEPTVAGLPERVLVLRDQIVGPNVPPPFAGGTCPTWDVSVNFVPVTYTSSTTTPAYSSPGQIRMQAEQKELWRVVNSSADAILDFQVLYDGVPQVVQVVGLDGIPVGSQDGTRRGHTIAQTVIGMSPGQRAEFVISPPGPKVKSAVIQTLNINTGLIGDTDPVRILAKISTQSADTGLPRLPAFAGATWPQRFENLDDAPLTATRKLAFSETLQDPANPQTSPTNFYITVAGQTPTLYHPEIAPAITTKLGAVEEWTVENQALEAHVFHIHQIHYKMQAIDGKPLDAANRQFRDDYEIPGWNPPVTTTYDASGNPLPNQPYDPVSGLLFSNMTPAQQQAFLARYPYPNFTARFDFRDPNIVGAFVFHCHILAHEDQGMMAVIRVLP
jgi:FtsP/CotA-like multicopper oxidase with cupredoxin domain